MTGNGIHDRQRIRSYIGNRTCHLTLAVKTCGLILIGLIIDGRFKHIGIGNDLVSFLTDNNKRVVFQIVLRIFRNKIRVKHRIHGFHFDVRRKSRIAFQELLDRLIFLSAFHDLINGYILIQSTYQLFCGIADGGKLGLAQIHIPVLSRKFSDNKIKHYRNRQHDHADPQTVGTFADIFAAPFRQDIFYIRLFDTWLFHDLSPPFSSIFSSGWTVR